MLFHVFFVMCHNERRNNIGTKSIRRVLFAAPIRVMSNVPNRIVLELGRNNHPHASIDCVMRNQKSFDSHVESG